MARNNLTSGSDTVDRAAYVTAQIAPGPNRLLLAFIMNLRAGAGAQPAATPVLQGNGLTWELVTSVPVAGNADRRLTCFRAMGAAPTPGKVTISFGGETQTRCAWSMFEYDGVDTTGANGSGATLQPKTSSGNGASAAISLGPLADATRSIVAGGIVIALDKCPTSQSTRARVCRESTNCRWAIRTAREVRYKPEDRTGGQLVDWIWTGAENFAAIALEVEGRPPWVSPTLPLDDPEALAKRFEPILFFHPQERFFPSDAKRYLETCALWQAEAPFDQKGSWGGKASPFSTKSR